MLDISQVYARSDSVHITEAAVAHRQHLLQLADDEQAQLNRWQEVRTRRGRHPIERCSCVGDPVWATEQAEARRVALAVADYDERTADLRGVRERSGAAPSGNTTFACRDLVAERRISGDAAERRAHGKHTTASG